MKKILLTFVVMLATSSVFASSSADTILINSSDVSKIVYDTITTSKGKQSIKYYFIYKNKLISTNKSSIQTLSLCKRHDLECPLVLITSTTGKKRIIAL